MASRGGKLNVAPYVLPGTQTVALYSSKDSYQSVLHPESTRPYPCTNLFQPIKTLEGVRFSEYPHPHPHPPPSPGMHVSLCLVRFIPPGPTRRDYLP